MIIINLRNIEEFLFRNNELQKKFPEFQHYFNQWNLARQHSFLKQMGKQAVIDLLANLNEKHIEIFSKHFDVCVTIDKFNNRIVRQYEFEIDELSEKIDEIQDQGNMVLYRKDNQVYICTWR